MKLAIAFVLALLGASASAAPREPSIDELREVMYKYGRCVVKRERGEASRAILSRASNNVIRERYSALISPDCVFEATRGEYDMALRFAGDFYRFALADALVGAQLRRVIPSDLPAVAPLEHGIIDQDDFISANEHPGPEGAPAATRQQLASASVFLSRFGECVVRSDVGKAHTLLMARPATPQEDKAFTALTPALNNCVELGNQFSADRMNLRGAIALNYYRLAKAPRVAATEASR